MHAVCDAHIAWNFRTSTRTLPATAKHGMTVLPAVPRKHQLPKSRIGLSSPPDSDRSLATR